MVDIVPSHPGAVLDELFLKPLGWNADETARRLGVDRTTIENVIGERQAFDADLVVRLARLFGTDEHYWFRFQNAFDAYGARERAADDLDRIAPYESEAA